MSVFMTGGQAAELVNYVGWLQSTGTQFFNTNFCPDNNTRLVMDFEILSDAGGWRNPFGVREDSSPTDAFSLTINASSKIRSEYGSNYMDDACYFSGVSVVGRHMVDKNKNVCTLDGVVVTNTAQTFSNSRPLFLFAQNTTGTPSEYVAMRLYSCQIYDNGVLARDFRPCYNKNGVASLYDRVNKQYYANAGTGAFTAG